MSTPGTRVACRTSSRGCSASQRRTVADTGTQKVANRGAITACVILAVIMQALDTYTPEERGSAMGLFGVSVMVGPVLGPVIGGWLTNNISWRWVFYINLPLGVLAFAGMMVFVTETGKNLVARLDWLGFGALSV